MVVSNLLLSLIDYRLQHEKNVISGTGIDNSIEHKITLLQTINTLVVDLLQLDESILSVAVVNMKGQTVTNKSKYHISNGLSSKDVRPDCGIWIRSAFAMVEQCVKNYGNLETLVSYHEKVKLIVVPMREINSLIMLMVYPSTSAESIIYKVNTWITYHNSYSNWQNTCEQYHFS